MGALMERKVSEITSRRSGAAAKQAAQKQAIQAAFICGKAATLLRPLSTKAGDGSGTRGDASAQRLQIEMPAMIVEERIGDEAHVVQLGQKIEQGVAGLPDQHLIARIAEQAEEEAVAFAGTGGEKDLIGIDGNCVVTIILADGLARGAQTLGIRLVLERGRVVERRQNRRSIVGKAATGRVGDGQVE